MPDDWDGRTRVQAERCAVEVRQGPADAGAAPAGRNPVSPGLRAVPPTGVSSYGQILRSTSLIGGAQAISMVLGLVRTKGVALLIGPMGIGVLGNFVTIQALVGVVANLGVSSSAVRELAQAVSTGDAQTIARTVTALRRVSWLTGFAGLLALVAVAGPLSRWTFNTDAHVAEMALLGVAVFLTNISAGQAALIHGLRRIGDLAKLNIIGACGGIVSLGPYWWLGVRGVVPSLVLLASIQLVASWHYARLVAVAKVELTLRESLRAAGGMLRLGVVFMLNGLFATAAAYAIRVLVTRELDLAAVGVFGAAFTLSGMLVNVVLGAMGSDFYPRLTAVASQPVEANRLVNEQTEIGILLALPVLIGTLTLAPWLIRVFYSAEFAPAVGLLHWFVLGCLVRVISWPLGFLMLALAKDRWFAFTETSHNLLHVALAWAGLVLGGLGGVAIAFPLMYISYTTTVYLVARRLTGFRWTAAAWRLFVGVPVMLSAFILVTWTPLWPATVVGLVLTAVTSVLCLRGLVKRVGRQHRVLRFVAAVPGARWLLATE